MAQYAKSLKITPPRAFSHPFLCDDMENAKKIQKSLHFRPPQWGCTPHYYGRVVNLDDSSFMDQITP